MIVQPHFSQGRQQDSMDIDGFIDIPPPGGFPEITHIRMSMRHDISRHNVSKHMGGGLGGLRQSSVETLFYLSSLVM